MDEADTTPASFRRSRRANTCGGMAKHDTPTGRRPGLKVEI
jgi:hypothetical protein